MPRLVEIGIDGILCKFGVGKETRNGYRLLQFCRYNNLVIIKIWCLKLPRNSWIKNLKSLKFDNVEDGWNDFGKTICEVLMVSQGRKLRLSLCLIERRGFYKYYLSDRSYENN